MRAIPASVCMTATLRRLEQDWVRLTPILLPKRMFDRMIHASNVPLGAIML